MNGALVEPKPWHGRRWWSLVALVFGVQVALVWWLGQRQFPPPQLPAPAPVWQVAGPASAELLALTDPTLFALPHWRGFSGQFWLTAPSLPSRPFVWEAPPAWLALDQRQLGTLFHRFIATNPFTAWQPALRPDPVLLLPPLTETAADAPRSAVRLAGGLAGRQLLTPLDLPSWTTSEILKNTEVQVLVAADGRPLSATLTLAEDRSGLPEADQHALAQARKARFDPLKGATPVPAGTPLAGLTWGKLIFAWHTLPPAETNSVAGGD